MCTFKRYLESSLNPVLFYVCRASRNIKSSHISAGLLARLVHIFSSLLHVSFQLPSSCRCLFKLLRDEDKTNESGSRSRLKRNLTCWRCSYANSHLPPQTEMCSLLKCEAGLSLQVKVITEQREATGWRGQSRASVLLSRSYASRADRAAG